MSTRPWLLLLCCALHCLCTVRSNVHASIGRKSRKRCRRETAAIGFCPLLPGGNTGRIDILAHASRYNLRVHSTDYTVCMCIILSHDGASQRALLLLSVRVRSTRRDDTTVLTCSPLLPYPPPEEKLAAEQQERPCYSSISPSYSPTPPPTLPTMAAACPFASYL